MNVLRVGAPIHTAGVCLIPVERVWLHQHVRDGAAWAAGGQEPVAVVIREAEGLRAVNVAGEGVPLEALLADVDGLATALGVLPRKPDL